MNFQDFILGLEDKIGYLRQDVVDRISVAAGKDDFLPIVRTAGILEGITTTTEELKKFLKGESGDEEE